MALKFNAGATNEFVATEYYQGTYAVSATPQSSTNALYWLVEPCVPFNIAPFMKQYYNDNTKNRLNLVQNGSIGVYIGFSQQNDNVIAKMYVSPYYNFTICTIPVTSLDSPRNIYFIYQNRATGSGYSYLRLLMGSVNQIDWELTPVGDNTFIVGANDGQLHELTDFSYITGNRIAIPYSVNDVYKTRAYFERVSNPAFAFQNVSGLLDTVANDAHDNLAGLKNYDNTDPEPYDPPGPTPPEPEDPNDEGDPSDEDGGDGDHTPIYDPIPVPPKPTMGAANAGFITMYKLGLSAINQFASDMFASSVWEAIRLFFSNPIDFLVGCMLLPFEPETGSSYYPKFGVTKFAHAYPAVSNQYKDIDCGSVSVSKYWGSAFDYEPYTKIQIWLPYIGYRDLPVDEIMDTQLHVKYRVDCLTGDCVAFVSTGVVSEIGPQIPRVIAQFYGNCGVRVPFGSVSFDNAVAAGIQLIGAAATQGLSSGAGSVMAGSEGGVAVDEGYSSPSNGGLVNAAIGVVSNMKPNVQKGGAAGASTGYMSIQTPYLIRRIPRQNLPSNFMTLKGYPSNIGGKLADFTGLAIVDDIQLNDIPAMEDERREIMKWLTGGVLI